MKLLRFAALPVERKLFLVKVLTVIAVIRLGLWLLPFSRIDNYLGKAAALPVGSEIDWASVWQIVETVRAVGGYVPFASCLTQSLAARTLLAWRGQPSDLKIGVKREKELFEAHAWLEVGGEVVLGGSHSKRRFVALAKATVT